MISVKISPADGNMFMLWRRCISDIVTVWTARNTVNILYSGSGSCGAIIRVTAVVNKCLCAEWNVAWLDRQRLSSWSWVLDRCAAQAPRVCRIGWAMCGEAEWPWERGHTCTVHSYPVREKVKHVHTTPWKSGRVHEVVLPAFPASNYGKYGGCIYCCNHRSQTQVW